MHAVDTNLLVRFFLNDDPNQFAAACRVLASGPTYIVKTGLLEFEWVLRGVYGCSRTAIASAMEGLFSKADVEIEDSEVVEQALAWFKGGMDFADALHLASGAHTSAFLTFDARLRRRASMLGTVPTAVSP
jgi:predicted nucleic-acid-binding protein